MGETNKGRIPREWLQEWLDGGTGPLQASTPGGNHITLVKIPKQENVDYIFGQDNYYSSGVGWFNKFSFCGLYSSQNHILRLADDPLTDIVDGLTPEECMASERLLEQAVKAVNARVEAIVADDRENLPVKEITSAPAQKYLRLYQEDVSTAEAAEQFVSGEPVKVVCGNYSADHWTEEALVAYLTAPDAYIQAQAQKYIQENGENLLLEFLKYDAMSEKLRQIEANPDSPFHRMRDITQALRRCDAKMVTVTVQKDGEQLTFKTAANSLKGLKADYSTWDIPAPDRREFHRLFGEHTRYTAEDIIQITYNRAVIYQAPVEQTQEMAEGPVMGGMGL